jgi:hypothetical protein
MTEEETLYDRTPHDRHLDLMRMRRAPQEDPSHLAQFVAIAVGVLLAVLFVALVLP